MGWWWGRDLLFPEAAGLGEGSVTDGRLPCRVETVSAEGSLKRQAETTKIRREQKRRKGQNCEREK